jgi:hypothetical protein
MRETKMGFYALAGVLVLAGAVVAAFLPTGQRWLAVAGLAAAFFTGSVLWLTGGYDDFEGSPWVALALVVILLGGGWSLGVGFGNLMRDGLVRRRERLR